MAITVDRGETGRSAAAALEIGLVNNMPDSALESTERQFFDLLDAAAKGVAVRIRLFFMPDIPRSESGRTYLSGGYRPIDELWDTRLDGLIVTGTEPIAASLPDEPYWTSLTKLVDWAESNTASSIWSCLAAHAAVLYRDRIVRHALSEKKFGIFDCTRVLDHPLLANTSRHLRVPHSRWNDLRERELAAGDYRVLTRSLDAGVDCFVKERKSTFVFFQGHPEYDPRALLREYRRDVARFLRGQRATYPGMPRGYFDRSTIEVLNAYRERAIVDRSETALDDFPLALAERTLMPMVAATATRIYENWLSLLQERKCQRLGAATKPPRAARSPAAAAAQSAI